MKSAWAFFVAVFVANAAFAAPVIDGSSAPLWKACTTWVPRLPPKYEVARDGGVLRFHVEGRDAEMPWIIDLKDFGLSGDERYLLVRYQATGIATRPNVYFLHGEEGSHGGRNYANADSLRADGQWHTLAVDLLPIEPLEGTHNLAVKVATGDGGNATLKIEKIWFAERLPAEAQLAPFPPHQTALPVTLDWQHAGRIAPQQARAGVEVAVVLGEKWGVQET